MIRTALLVLTASCLLIFTACNTFHGMGKDIKSLGEKIEKSADK
ncbi:MAG: entericidin, EcnA/B family [Nitrospiraceae bacterium]|nr:MAG: entericidin, EcnA/B family [Nitrospiraceae bacterium]